MERRMPQYDSDNKFELRTSQCKPFKAVFDCLKECVTDVDIVISEYGLSINAADVSQTMAVKLELNEFDHFYFNPEGNSIEKLNVSVPNINKVLKTVSNDDDIISWCYKAGADEFTTIISSSSKGESREYIIKIQENDDMIERIPQCQMSTDQYEFILTMPCADFQKICRDLKNLDTQKVKISYSNENLIFQYDCSVAEKCKIVRHGAVSGAGVGSDKQIIFQKLPEEGNCSVYDQEFKFEHLFNFGKCASIGSKFLKIALLDSLPLIMIFDVGTLGQLSFGLQSVTEDKL